MQIYNWLIKLNQPVVDLQLLFVCCVKTVPLNKFVTGLQLIKKFPEFYGTQKFITAFTSASNLSLPGNSSIQSIAPPPNS